VYKNSIRSVGGYNAELAPVEDWDLSLKLSMIGSIYILPEILYVRRLHNNNTAKDHPNKNKAIEEIVKNYKLTNYQFKSFRSDFKETDIY